MLKMGWRMMGVNPLGNFHRLPNVVSDIADICP